MDGVLPSLKTGARLSEALPAAHEARRLVEDSLKTRGAHGPLMARLSDGVPGPGSDPREGERQLATHPVPGARGELVGVMLVALNLDYLSQVHSTISYSRKLAALGRLFAGVTHEVKNPLNAMTIHLELLRGKLEKLV